MPDPNQRQAPPQPQVTTPPIHHTDHSWTMQAIGALTQSVNTLVKQVEASEQKHDQVKDAIARIDKKLYAAGVIITLLIVVGGFVLNKVVDFGMDMAKEAIKTPPAVSAPIEQSTPKKK